MSGRRLILNSNITIENGTAGCSDGSLWLYFAGYTLQEAATMLFDPANTASIVFQYGEMEDTYEGYTNIRILSVDTDGNISVCLKKGES